MNVADYLVEQLKIMNIDRIFGVSGGVIEPFLNSLALEKHSIKTTMVFSENQAAFMAQSYGYEKKSFGVCFCIWGAGQTNMLNAASSSYIENRKLLIISGAGSETTESRYPAQDASNNGVNSFEMFNNCTCYNEKITSVDHAVDKIRQAILTMLIEEKPVHLHIPNSILSKSIYYQPTKITPPKKPIAQIEDINFIKKIVNQTNKINLIIGKKCNESINDIIDIAIHFNLNLIDTPSGKGLINSNIKNYKGTFGIAGKLNDEILKEADYNIFIGDLISEENSKGWNQNLINLKMIYIHDNIKEICIPYHLKKIIYTDIASFFKIIKKDLNIKKINQKEFYTQQKTKNVYDLLSSPINPENFMSMMSEIISKDSIAFFDIGNSFLWGIKCWENHYVRENGIQQFRIGIGFGTMTWALGNAIGASYAHPDKKILCFIGDGSLLMASQEILNLKNSKLPIVFVILNDSSLGTVRHGQNLSNSFSMINELPNIDFHSFYLQNGIKSYKIKNLKDIENIKQDIQKINEPLVLDVLIDKNICPPIKDRIKNLKE